MATPAQTGFSPAPAHYFNFNTTNGTTFTDSLGGQDLTKTTSIALTTTSSPAIAGNSAFFNQGGGSTGSAASSSSALVPPSQAVTIAGWFGIATNSFFGTQTLWGKSANFGQDFRLTSNQSDIKFYFGGGSVLIQTPVSYGTFHHFVVTWDPVATGGSVYYDGSLVNTYSGGGPISSSTFTLCGDLGTGDNGGTNLVADEFAVFFSVLSGAKVTELYNRGLANTPIA